MWLDMRSLKDVKNLTAVKERLTSVRLPSPVDISALLLPLRVQCSCLFRVSLVAVIRLIMHRSHDWVLYFDEDTLICTLVIVRCLYFAEDTLIRTLVGVR